MQKTITLTFLIAFTFALCGCVNRTVRNDTKGQGTHGSKASEGKVISEQRVWIWQKEFRNSQ